MIGKQTKAWCSKSSQGEDGLSEINVFTHELSACWHWGFDQLVQGFDAISWRSSSGLQENLLVELASLFIYIFDWHVLLMEDDMLSNLWCFYAYHVSNILQYDQTVWNVLPEESRVYVQLYLNIFLFGLLQVLAFNWQHWEWHSWISDVGIEYSLERWGITDLSIVHSFDPLWNWHNLVQVYIWAPLEDGLFDSLNFIIKTLNLICWHLIESLIQKWNIFELQHFVSLLWEFTEEASDSSWVNDLITWAQNEVHETWDWYARKIESLWHSTAHVMHILNWISYAVEHFLWTNDINVFSIVNSLANEWHVLKAEDG